MNCCVRGAPRCPATGMDDPIRLSHYGAGLREGRVAMPPRARVAELLASGGPDLNEFPFAVWRKLSGAASARTRFALFDYADTAQRIRTAARRDRRLPATVARRELHGRRRC